MNEFGWSLSYWIKPKGGEWRFITEYFSTYAEMFAKFDEVFNPANLNNVGTITATKTKEKNNEKNDSYDFVTNLLYGCSSDG